MMLPEGVDLKIDKQTHLVLSGHDRQLLGQVAANMRALRAGITIFFFFYVHLTDYEYVLLGCSDFKMDPPRRPMGPTLRQADRFPGRHP